MQVVAGLPGPLSRELRVRVALSLEDDLRPKQSSNVWRLSLLALKTRLTSRTSCRR